jgi:hypothetical protein
VYVCIQPGRIKEVGGEKKRKEGLNSKRKEGKEQSNGGFLPRIRLRVVIILRDALMGEYGRRKGVQ